MYMHLDKALRMNMSYMYTVTEFESEIESLD